MNVTHRVNRWHATINVRNQTNVFQAVSAPATRSSVLTANVSIEKNAHADCRLTTARWSTVKAMFAIHARLTRVKMVVSWRKIKTARCVNGLNGHHSRIAPMHVMEHRVATEHTTGRTVQTNRLKKTRNHALRTVPLSVTPQHPMEPLFNTMSGISFKQHAATNRTLECLKKIWNRQTSFVPF